MTKKLRHNRIIIIATVLLSLAAIIVIGGLIMGPPEELLQGQAETTDYRISSKLPSRVKEIRVHEGDSVHRGDTVVILEVPELDAQRAVSVAGYEAAEAKASEVEEGSRQEVIAEARHAVARNRANYDDAEADYRRAENLFQEDVISEQKRDQAKAHRDALAAQLRVAEAQLDLALNGSRQQAKRAANERARGARERIGEVDALLRETVLTASEDGVVTEVFAERGELLGLAAPIMNIATNDYWFTFNIPEDKLVKVRVGQQMRIRVPATGKDIEARVTRMKNVGDFAAWKATKTLAEYDLKVFEVRLQPLKPVTGLRDGMSVLLVTEQ